MRIFDYSKFNEKMWPNKIVSYIAKINECKGRQKLFVMQKPAELDRLVELAKIQSTESSNKIEGIVTTTSRIKQLVEQKILPKNRSEKEIVGYKDVLKTIHESHDFIKLNVNNILQLHRDLLAHTDISYCGKFKNSQNYITETKLDGSVVTRFVPLSPFETPDAVERLCKTFNNAIESRKVEPLILIPIFILDFLCIHPFNDGNGRMSRLLTLLLLYQNGYEVGKYISIEKEIEKTKDIYYEVLESSNLGWNEGKNDPMSFIDYMLQIILACYRIFEERVEILNINDPKKSAYDIVKKYVEKKIGKFISTDVIVACPQIARSSVLSALNKLCKEKIITKMGNGKNTFYVCN